MKRLDDWSIIIVAVLAVAALGMSLEHCASVDARRAKDECRLRGGKVEGGKDWTCSFGPRLRVDADQRFEP